MSTEINQRLTEIFKKVFEDENIKITPEMTAADVANWDSLSHVAMIEKVEKEFGIKFKLKEIISMKKVGDLISLIEKHRDI